MLSNFMQAMCSSRLLAVVVLIYGGQAAAEGVPPTIRIGSSWSGYPAQRSIAANFTDEAGQAPIRLRAL